MEFNIDDFFEEMFGEDNQDDLANESGDDDFNPDDIKEPEFDEGDDDDVEKLLNSIETGDTDDMEDDDYDADSDLAELEKEYHITAAGGDAMGSDPIDDEFPELDEMCSDPDLGEGGCCDENGNPLEPLDPELDMRGDQMLAAIATPDLVETMLSDDEYADFIESGDASVAASEGFLEDYYVEDAMNCDEFGFEDVFGESAFAPEGKKYKMTKKAKLRQLYAISLQIEARLHNDPGYPRMQKVYKIRRSIKAQWHQRYGALAMRRAKRYLKGLMKSKSNGIKKVATRLVGSKK